MGCNCKKGAKKLAQLDGQGEYVLEEGKLNFVEKIIKFFMQAVFGLIASALILILAVPLLIYISVCMMLGAQPTVRIFNPLLGKHKIKNNENFQQDAEKRMKQIEERLLKKMQG